MGLDDEITMEKLTEQIGSIPTFLDISISLHKKSLNLCYMTSKFIDNETSLFFEAPEKYFPDRTSRLRKFGWELVEGFYRNEYNLSDKPIERNNDSQVL